MRKLLLLAIVLGLLVSANVWAEGFSVGPERFFLNGQEVSRGTRGAISGDVLARENLCKPEPIRLKSPEGYWYVGVGSSVPDREITPTINPPIYIYGVSFIIYLKPGLQFPDGSTSMKVNEPLTKLSATAIVVYPDRVEFYGVPVYIPMENILYIEGKDWRK
jgi:hypothetical protein